MVLIVGKCSFCQFFLKRLDFCFELPGIISKPLVLVKQPSVVLDYMLHPLLIRQVVLRSFSVILIHNTSIIMFIGELIELIQLKINLWVLLLQILCPCEKTPKPFFLIPAVFSTGSKLPVKVVGLLLESLDKFFKMPNPLARFFLCKVLL